VGRGCCGPKSSSSADLDFGHQGLLPAGFSAFSSPAAAHHAFPRADEIEGAKFLAQVHGLVDDALLLDVVAHLDIAGERKVLAQRMAFEAVVGEQAAQVG